MTDAHTLNRTLGLGQVVIFGLAYMAPMVVFGTYGPVVKAAEGMAAGAYLLALVAMLFTAYAYSLMARRYPATGSAYTYVSKAMGRRAGLLIGWAVMLDYLLLPVAEAAINAVFLSAYFPDVPRWIWIVVFVVLLAVVNLRGVKLAANLNVVLVIFQFVLVGLFAALSVKGLLSGTGAGTLISVRPFFDPDKSSLAVLSGAAIVVVSYLGFDAVTTLAEETKDAQRTIPRAIILVTLCGGLLFIATSYLMVLVQPDFRSFKKPESPALELFMIVGGNFMVAFFLACRTVGSFAAQIASQATVTRLLFAMGRDGVIPKGVFAKLHPRYQTPMGAQIFVSIVVLVLSLTLGLDLLFSLVSVGALVAFAFVNLSVISQIFVRENRRSGMDLIRYLVVPVIGFCTTMTLWVGLGMDAKIAGAAWVATGFVYLLVVLKGREGVAVDLPNVQAGGGPDSAPRS